MDTAAEPPRWPTKIAVLLREDLAPWQTLNVTSFLVSGITATGPELVGEPYQDADGTGYLPMLRQPVLVLEPFWGDLPGTREEQQPPPERPLGSAGRRLGPRRRHLASSG